MPSYEGALLVMRGVRTKGPVRMAHLRHLSRAHHGASRPAEAVGHPGNVTDCRMCLRMKRMCSRSSTLPTTLTWFARHQQEADERLDVAVPGSV